MDKDNKKIKLNHNINISGVNIPLDLTSLTNLDGTTGGSADLFKGASGNCLTLSEFLDEKWADYNNGFLLSELIGAGGKMKTI
jgi:hypothetical protein